MANNYTGNLVESTGNTRLRGVIKGLTPPCKKGFGYEDVPAKDGKKPYRRIKFHVQTSTDNSPVVELFGSPRDFAYAYNKTEKKSMKIEWAKRFNPLPKGYEIITPEYDFVKKLNEEFKDGDEVVIVGDKPRFSTYENPTTGIKTEQQSLNIKQVYPCTEKIDFDAEDFKEEATFAEDIVIRDFAEDKKLGRAYVYAYVIYYGGKFSTATFTIDLEKVNKTFYRNIKSLKFGDFIRVNGDIQYKTLKEAVTVDDGWGTNEKVADKVYKALEITGADGAGLMKKRYKIADFAETQEDKAKDLFNGKIQNVEQKVSTENSTVLSDTPETPTGLPFSI